MTPMRGLLFEDISGYGLMFSSELEAVNGVQIDWFIGAKELQKDRIIGILPSADVSLFDTSPDRWHGEPNRLQEIDPACYQFGFFDGGLVKPIEQGYQLVEFLAKRFPCVAISGTCNQKMLSVGACMGLPKIDLLLALYEGYLSPNEIVSQPEVCAKRLVEFVDQKHKERTKLAGQGKVLKTGFPCLDQVKR